MECRGWFKYRVQEEWWEGWKGKERAEEGEIVGEEVELAVNTINAAGILCRFINIKVKFERGVEGLV